MELVGIANFYNQNNLELGTTNLIISAVFKKTI